MFREVIDNCDHYCTERLTADGYVVCRFPGTGVDGGGQGGSGPNASGAAGSGNYAEEDEDLYS